VPSLPVKSKSTNIAPWAEPAISTAARADAVVTRRIDLAKVDPVEWSRDSSGVGYEYVGFMPGGA
jgi:hypothetical protein